MEKVDQSKGKVMCILQARMGSRRLPGKVLLRVQGVPLLEREVKRIKRAKTVDKIVIATTTNKEDDAIENLAKRIGVDCFRGSEKDVLDRYYQCALLYPGFSSIVRVTGDCPLIDPLVIDQVISLFRRRHLDYASNIQKETFPDGMDIEVFTRKALAEAAIAARLPSEKEHVTLYMRKKRKFKKANLAAEYDFSHIRLTVDQREDFEVVKFLIEHSSMNDGYLKYISLLTKNPEIMTKNTHIARNEGLKKSIKEDRVMAGNYLKT